MNNQKNIMFVGSSKHNFKRVYKNDTINEIKKQYNALSLNLFNKREIENNPKLAEKTNYIFSTWGMEKFTEAEIKKYFPNLEAVFYGAGSVQDFAEPFIKSGVKVFSAYRANAIPVIEFTYAQIILASKGFFGASRKCRFNRYGGFKYSDNCGGMYKTKVGILGVGAIGRGIAEKLQENDVELYYYDPFLSKETAEKLHLKEATLKEIFSECNIITNHLANKDELTHILNGELFSLMKPYSTFINTGRGRQVDEKGLAKAMKSDKTRTALLDVTYPEPPNSFGRLFRRKNIILTPHIAGSNGREVERMAQYMVDESLRFSKGENLMYEVTAEMLKNMA